MVNENNKASKTRIYCKRKNKDKLYAVYEGEMKNLSK